LNNEKRGERQKGGKEETPILLKGFLGLGKVDEGVLPQLDPHFRDRNGYLSGRGKGLVIGGVRGGRDIACERHETSLFRTHWGGENSRGTESPEQ